MIKESRKTEEDAVMTAADLIAAAARTAPKTRGIDNLKIAVVTGDDITLLRDKMTELSASKQKPSLKRDAANLRDVKAVLILGIKSNPAGLNCGFCNSPTCDELLSKGGVCSFNNMDLGIAMCSAAALASNLRIDNRIMYSIGLAVMDTNLFGEDVASAVGIPLSVTGKNPFFDRN